MGLDMYLTKRSAAARDEQDEMVAYWRKANHIHGWFERNVAYGELENCELYPVSFEQRDVAWDHVPAREGESRERVGAAAAPGGLLLRGQRIR